MPEGVTLADDPELLLVSISTPRGGRRTSWRRTSPQTESEAASEESAE